MWWQGQTGHFSKWVTELLSSADVWTGSCRTHARMGSGTPRTLIEQLFIWNNKQPSCPASAPERLAQVWGHIQGFYFEKQLTKNVEHFFFFTLFFIIKGFIYNLSDSDYLLWGFEFILTVCSSIKWWQIWKAHIFLNNYHISSEPSS